MMEKATQFSEVKQAITIRYGEIADSCCSLSCGSALDHGAVVRGETVVDLGSGRGQDVFKAAQRVGGEGFVYGVDFTDEMVALAESTRKKLRIENVRFLRSSIDAIPLENGVVDVVVSNCTINHAPDKGAVYREIHRILKSAGRFVVSDIIAREELPDAVKNDPDAWAGCYGGAITEEAYLEAVRDGGFTDVEIIEMSEPYEKGGVFVKSITLRGYKQDL